ncbi:MAG: sigma-70 family RNA polymerase sigma factor [Acidobacteria bacterium]|nr:sigma-70 family RNA polymerase sigma factor [Acidobacteriota bacterium]
MGIATEDEFRAFAVEAIPIIANYARRRLAPLSTSELDDIVARVLEVAWRRRGDIPDEAPLAWTIGVTRRTLANAHRSYRRRRALIARQRSTGTTNSAEEQVSATRTVSDALSQLSESDREILALHYWDGVDVPGVAQILNITTNAAAVRLTRARQRFETAYREIAST